MPVEDTFEYQFEKSIDLPVKEDIDNRKILIQLDDVSFGQAMGIISSEYKVPIVWTSTLDKESVSGRFDNVPLRELKSGVSSL